MHAHVTAQLSTVTCFRSCFCSCFGFCSCSRYHVEPYGCYVSLSIQAEGRIRKCRKSHYDCCASLQGAECWTRSTILPGMLLGVHTVRAAWSICGDARVCLAHCLLSKKPRQADLCEVLSSFAIFVVTEALNTWQIKCPTQNVQSLLSVLLWSGKAVTAI